MESRVIKFLKDWMLIISMSVGILSYLIYHFTPALYPIGPAIRQSFSWLQPLLIFLMLFLQFNKVSPHDLRFKPWHLWLLLIQGVVFTLVGFIISRVPEGVTKVLLESFAVCIICPTATASGVITEKLGGSIPDNMTYLVMINATVSLLFPLMIPVMHPIEGLTFFQAFSAILMKVFPTLIFPALAAWLIRYTWHGLQVRLMRYSWMAFYLWGISLCICLVLTTRTVMLNHLGVPALIAIGLISAVSCVLQFSLGHILGKKTGEKDRITAGQALGQKNTALMIWIGYTYLTPQTAVAGGLYSICHNIVNSIELRQAQSSGQSLRKDS